MRLGPLIDAERERDVGQRQQRANDGEPQQHLGDGFTRDDIGEQPGTGKREACADLRQRAVERLVEAEHVDGEPAIAFADAGRGAVEEDHQRGVEDALAGRLVHVLGDAVEHQPYHRQRDQKDQLLAEWQPAKPDGEHHGAEDKSATENAPVDGFGHRAIETNQQSAGDRDDGHDEPQQEHGLIGIDLREPAGETGHRQDARPQRKPTEHLNETELALELVFRFGRAVGIRARHHLRGHGVGDHVLHDDADHDKKLRRDVERVLAGERDPAASRTRHEHHARRHKARADKHINPALRAEDRHRVGKLAEHHLDGPRQRQPHPDGGKLRGAEAQRLLDPERLGDGDEAERAIGVIDHEQRQVAQPHGADRGDQRGSQLVKRCAVLRRGLGRGFGGHHGRFHSSPGIGRLFIVPVDFSVTPFALFLSIDFSQGCGKSLLLFVGHEINAFAP